MTTVNSGHVICDVIVGTTRKNVISKNTISSLPSFDVSDKIKIGGSSSFIGELSAINIYAPGAIISPGINDFFSPIFE